MFRNISNSHRKYIKKEKLINMLFSIFLWLLCKSVNAIYELIYTVYALYI